MKTMKLRPHHLLCLRFRIVVFPDRSGKFPEAEQMVMDAIRPESGVMIHVAEGVDGLCRACPNCGAGRCDDPNGNEEVIRERDAIILTGLGVSYGDAMTSREWHDLVREKTPLKFCLTRCPAMAECVVTRKKAP
jgi:hypothetical protein